MLTNAYFLAKFRFDTAENEPAKKLQNFANFADPSLLVGPNLRSGTRGGVRGPFSPSAALAWLLQRASDRYETLREKDPDGETKIKIE